MVKKRTQLAKQVPSQKIQTRKSSQLKKLSAQPIKEIPHISKVIEKPQNSQKESASYEFKQKTHLSNEDIDMYFASCISQTSAHKLYSLHENQRNLQNISNSINLRQNSQQEIKEQYVQGYNKYQELGFEKIQEQNEENQCQDQQFKSQSPIFGRKMQKNQAQTPKYKLEQLKIYEQSQEISGRDNIMDQLESGSKVPFIQEKNLIQYQQSSENQIHRLNNRITKKKKKNQSSKKKSISTFLPLEETQVKWNTNHSHETMSQTKRRAQMLRLSCLKKSKDSYENSLETLKKTSNFLKSVMYYYEVRQHQQKVYSFRSNVFQVLNDEIRKLRNTLTLKRQICSEAIQKKMKICNYSMWESQQQKGSVF